MPTFAVRAATSAGRIVRSTQEADTPESVRADMLRRGLFPLAIDRAEGPRQRVVGGPGRAADEAALARYLASLMGAGVSIDRALAITARCVARRDVSLELERVRTEVRAGGSLSDAMSSAHVLPATALGMLVAGERSGRLAHAFEQMAEYLETRSSRRRELTSALSYPLLMIASGVAATAVLVLFVIPRFAVLLEEAGAALPASTRMLLGLSGFLEARWLPLSLATLAGAAGLISGLRNPLGRLRLHAVLLRLPIIGTLRGRIAAAQFGRALAVLLDQGAPMPVAIRTARDATTDQAFRVRVTSVLARVEAGAGLAPSLGNLGVLPYAFLQMVEIGEESGRLPEMLDRAATFEEQETDREIGRLIQLAEPSMIVGFGAGIGFVALALLQAIYGIHGGLAP